MDKTYTFSYDRLWHRLIDLKMRKKDLMKMAHLTTNAIANMGKGRSVSLETLARVCTVLDCELSDLVEVMETNVDAGNNELTRD